MKIREQKRIVRHDMINLLLQSKKGQLKNNNTTQEKLVDGLRLLKIQTLENRK